ncbi:MAG TPA: cyclic nucleotide-binding domain-containing protein [Candidatus Dormibacteraeota bacterium]|nr:cyclic nucleotide-binding domain-containing protein [Candidatus Dormibacteraeota bacterium]
MAWLRAISSTSAAAGCTSGTEAGGRGHVGALDCRLQALRSTAALAHCSSSQLRSLLRYVDEVAVPAGCRLAVEGRPCSQFVIVTEGRLRTDSLRGESRTLRAGDCWGWNAMWERSLNDATVVVESDARLLVMGHAQFRAAKAVASRRQLVPGQPA